jgi:hypothetical protein
LSTFQILSGMAAQEICSRFARDVMPPRTKSGLRIKRQAANDLAGSLPSFKKKSNRKLDRLRLADGSVHRLATLNGGEAGVDGHVDVLTEELHGSVAEQEQTPTRVIAAEVRET